MRHHLHTGPVSGIAGILLTGGASRRMGTDKASVLLAGESCAARIGQLLRTVAAPVIEVGRGRTEFDVVTETPAGGGPLLALVAGYRHLTHLGHHGPILLLACDLPLVSKTVLSALAKWPGQGSVVPLVNGRAQPLCARWSVDDLERAEALVAGGDRSMRALLGAPTVTLVDPTSWDPVLGLAAFSDFDVPEDLVRLGFSRVGSDCRWEPTTGDPTRTHRSASSSRWMHMPSGDDWIAVTEQPVPVTEAIAWVVQAACGALVTFCGTVRDFSKGRPGVTHLDYEAYPQYAEPVLGGIAADARERWPCIGRLVLMHRIGRLAVEDTAVLVAVSTPHRAEAFEAARYCIDTLKATAPIWKRETWSGGTDWGTCSHVVDGAVPVHTSRR